MPPGGRNWKLINPDWYLFGNSYLCKFLEAEKGLVNWSHNSAALEKNDTFKKTLNSQICQIFFSNEALSLTQ